MASDFAPEGRASFTARDAATRRRSSVRSGSFSLPSPIAAIRSAPSLPCVCSERTWPSFPVKSSSFAQRARRPSKARSTAPIGSPSRISSASRSTVWEVGSAETTEVGRAIGAARSTTLRSRPPAGRVRAPERQEHVDDKLQEIEQRFERLTADLGNPEVIGDRTRFSQVAKERAQLEELVETFREAKKVRAEVAEYSGLVEDKDPEMRSLAKEELPALQAKLGLLNERLKVLLLPRDPNDDRSVILEVRAGAGGDEAGLFAQELLRMYLRYAERKGWKATLMDTSDNASGGIKDASVTIDGDGVFSFLKYESGVHRVQRVPATEAQGRIHTSTATVSVMPEAEDVDVQINPADIQMDVMRSTGAGGQGANTTDSAVRPTRKPTGVVVKCQQEKSQLKNRAMALKMLRTRLYEMELEKQQSARDAARKSQVGTGDRSEKIRTYNFPQDRLTDHRIGLTRHNLAAVMDGDIEDVIIACRTYFQAEALQKRTQGAEQPGAGQ